MRSWAAAMALCAASVAHADETVVTHRVAVPLDGSVIDVGPLLGEERTVVFEGTVSNHLDGAELDAFARSTDRVRFEADGPWVLLPAGAQVVDEDVEGHRYTVRFAEGPAPVSFAVGRLARMQLVTRSEQARSLSGRIEALVMGHPAPAAAGIVEPGRPSPGVAEDAGVSWLAVGSGIAALPLFGLLLFGMRRRKPEEDALSMLLKRAERAMSSIGTEAQRLGPAFRDVEVASERLMDAARDTKTHADELDAARARIAGEGVEATERRRELMRERRLAEERLEGLVERLEGVAARLASQVADHARAKGVDDVLGKLGDELDLALRADDEARATT